MKESCERIASVLGINPNADNFTAMQEQLRSPTNHGSPLKVSDIGSSTNFYQNSFGIGS